jgi:flagellar basal-body rod protein FlgG
MSNALELSALGMINEQQRLDVIAHNLANASTVGFKRDISVNGRFDNQLALELNNILVETTLATRALGIPSVETIPDRSAGVMRLTGNALDIAIEGDGFFEFIGPAGALYGRNGSLTLDAGGRLVSATGMPVGGVGGEILLTGSTPRINADGQVFEGDELVGQLKLIRFADPNAAEKVGSGLYTGGTPIATEADSHTRFRQGFLEASNVPVMEEMVRLMTTTRLFEMQQRVAKAFDGMLDGAIQSIADF